MNFPVAQSISALKNLRKWVQGLWIPQATPGTSASNVYVSISTLSVTSFPIYSALISLMWTTLSEDWGLMRTSNLLSSEGGISLFPPRVCAGSSPRMFAVISFLDIYNFTTLFRFISIFVTKKETDIKERLSGIKHLQEEQCNYFNALNEFWLG